MRIFDETKTKELENPDLSKGRLGNDVIVTHHEGREGTQEQGHYEVVAEYPNGGKDVKWIVDVPAVLPIAPYDTEEDIYVYIPFTEQELIENDIVTLKQKLVETDWIASKLAEAVSKYIETGNNEQVIELRTKYAKELSDRESWRLEINNLEEKLSKNT